jgi:hypothetical protein
VRGRERPTTRCALMGFTGSTKELTSNGQAQARIVRGRHGRHARRRRAELRGGAVRGPGRRRRFSPGRRAPSQPGGMSSVGGRGCEAAAPPGAGVSALALCWAARQRLGRVSAAVGFGRDLHLMRVGQLDVRYPRLGLRRGAMAHAERSHSPAPRRSRAWNRSASPRKSL